MSDIKTISYEKTSVGKRLKGSKHKHTWRLQIGQDGIEVTLLLSRLSGKREVFVNGVNYFSGKKFSSCMLNYVHGDHTLNLLEDKEIDLFIDLVHFSKFNPVPADQDDWESQALPYKPTKSSAAKLVREDPDITL